MRRTVVEGGLGMRACCRAVAEALVRQGEIVMHRCRITSRAECGAEIGDGFAVAAGPKPECAAIDPRRGGLGVQFYGAIVVAVGAVGAAERLPGPCPVGVTGGRLGSGGDAHAERLDRVEVPGHSLGTETSMEVRPEGLWMGLARLLERKGGECELSGAEMREADAVIVSGSLRRARRGPCRGCAS